MNSAEFRNELQKIMPGYAWTVHKPHEFLPLGTLVATGIQSSGFNRLSTLGVTYTEPNDRRPFPWYEVKSAPYGAKSSWAGTASGGTLARALRQLQKHYEERSEHFRVLANNLQNGRQSPTVARGAA